MRALGLIAALSLACGTGGAAPDAGLERDASADDASADDASADDASADDASADDARPIDGAALIPDAGDTIISDAGSRPARVAFTRIESGVARVHRLEGGALVPLTGGPGSDYSPAWSPDGRRIAFVSSRAGGPFALYVLDVDTGITSTVATALAQVASPAWHPARDLLVVAGKAAVSDRPDIYTVALDGQTDRLTTEASSDVGPSFTSDGLSVVFASNRSGAFDLYRMPLATRRATRLTRDSGLLGRATVRVGGCEVVFARADAARMPELVAIDICGPMMAPALLGQAGDEPSFSPDGTHLVFSTARFGGSALMLWDRAAAPVRLTTGAPLAVEGAIAP